MPSNKNLNLVKEIREKVAKAKSITFTDYLGLGVNDFNDLRQKIRDEDAELLVAKNTLIKLALEEENVKTDELEEDLKGPTAAIFSYSDPIAPVKTIFEFAKRLELPKVKSALVDGLYNNSAQVEMLSQLPSREELIAKIVGSLKSPLSGLTNTLGGVQRKFVYALNAVADKKSSE